MKMMRGWRSSRPISPITTLRPRAEQFGLPRSTRDGAGGGRHRRRRHRPTRRATTPASSRLPALVIDFRAYPRELSAPNLVRSRL